MKPYLQPQEIDPGSLRRSFVVYTATCFGCHGQDTATAVNSARAERILRVRGWGRKKVSCSNGSSKIKLHCPRCMGRKSDLPLNNRMIITSHLDNPGHKP